MGRAKIDSDSAIARKLFKRGQRSEAELQRSLNLAKGQYIARGQAKIRATEANSPYMSTRPGAVSAYDKRSVTVRRTGFVWKFIVDADSQPYAELGNRGEPIKARQGRFLALPVQPQKVERIRGAGGRTRGGGRGKARYKIRGSQGSGPPVIISDGSRYFRQGTKIALVKEVKPHDGHRLILESLRAAFRRR